MQKEIEFALAREEEAATLVKMQAAGELPTRVTHNDTKLNNILIDKNGILTFSDDGEIKIRGGASGWPYEKKTPSLLENGKVYDMGDITTDVDLSAMTFGENETLIQTCEIWFKPGDTIFNFSWPEGLFWIDYDDGSMPTLLPNMKYRIAIRNEITNLVASISYAYSA